ncbi:lysostaphin resistance A-like protein [Mariniluteicoccus flavus]
MQSTTPAPTPEATGTGWRNPVTYVALYALLAHAMPEIVGRFVPQERLGVWNAVTVAAYAVLGAAGIVLFRETLRAALADCRRHPWRVLGSAVGAFLVVFLASAVLLAVRGGATPVTENQTAVNQLLQASVLSTVIIVVVGPLAEELIFREVLIGRLRRWAPLWVLCLLSTAAFALIHLKSFTLGGLADLGQYVILGAVLSVLYVRSKGKLAYPLAAHLFNNLMATLLFYASRLASAA